MEDTSPLLASIAVSIAAAAGTRLLRQSWSSKAPLPAQKHGGWALIVAALIIPTFFVGTARGFFVALALVSTVALCVVASGYTRRTARIRVARDSLAPEPSERPTTKWREALRWALAGPIGMIAAMAVGIAYSALIPGEPQTRLVIGGLIVPFAWGGAMAWTLADDRILRATAVLVGVAVIGFGAAMMKGFA